MRCGSITVLVGVAFFLHASPGFAQKGPKGEQEAAKNGWLSSLSEGKAQAAKTGKPLFVVVRCVP